MPVTEKIKVDSIKELIPIFGYKDMQVVNARTVWEFLEVKKDFLNWIKQYIKKYDFIEGEEYVCSPNLGSKEGGGEYYVCPVMAWKLAIDRHNSKGEEAVQYFRQYSHIAQKIIISARKIWEVLGVKEKFADWIQEYIKNYGFIEGQDYVCYPQLNRNQGRGGNKIQEYYISPNMSDKIMDLLKGRTMFFTHSSEFDN